MSNLKGNNKRILMSKNIVSIVTIVSYIIFSIIKRLLDNPKLYWLPLILLIANCIYLVRSFYVSYQTKELSNNIVIWYVIQFIVNIAFILFINTYL